jgi:hypothetical protein
MLKRSVLIYGVVAAVVVSFSATHASFALAAGQPVVSFRLAQPKESHFDDAASAKRLYDTLRQLGCAAKQESHGGHYDVVFNAPKWLSVKFKDDREADQWAHWLTATGFETVHVQPADSGHLEIVAFRLPAGKSGHFDTAAQADGQADTLRMIGCEVKQDSHGGHYDVAYSCNQWRTIGLESHDVAHNWEKWLKANGFETSHDHQSAQAAAATNRR